MKYFLDSKVKIDDQQIEIATYYSSNYTGQSGNNIEFLSLDTEVQKKINHTCFHAIPTYYNFNETAFKKFYNYTGIDIWFFGHFRLYFQYRNFLLNLACIQLFLQKYPEGIVLTTDHKLEGFIPLSNIQFVHGTKTGLNKMFFIKECWTIMKQLRSLKSFESNHVIIGLPDQIESRFGNLTKSFDLIYNRNQFDAKKTLNSDFKKYRTKNNVDNIVARYLLSLKWIKDLKVLKNGFKAIQKNLKDNAEDAHLIHHFFFNQKMSYYIFYIRYRAFYNFFNTSKIESVILVDENSPQQRAIQYAAKAHHLKTYAIQHGAIYALHPAYMYGKYQSKPLLPDLTFTWGDYYANLLINEGGYIEKQVQTTGRIPEINTKNTSHEILQTTKEIVLYATQPQPDENMRKKELMDVFSSIKALGNRYQLVLRPHPSEKDDAYFNSIGESLNFRDFCIDRKSDLKTHFEKCAILITSYSTVGAEFIPYYKPLLVLDYLKTDLVNYIKQGVGIPIYNQNDLVKTLNQPVLNINKTAYQVFENNYFYKNGTQAIKLIVNSITAASKD